MAERKPRKRRKSSAEPSASAERGEATRPIEALEPTASHEAIELPGPSEALEPASADATEPRASAEATEAPASAEPTEPAEPGQLAERAEPTERVEVVQSPEVVESGAAAEVAGAAARRGGWPVWPWLALLLVLVAAGAGLLLGNALGSRQESVLPDQLRGVQARPTIVIAARPAAASPVAVGSPSLVGSPVARKDQQQEDEEYVVQAGDSLRSIAQRLYGDVELWTRLYERNRDVIGPNPNTLQPGMRLRVPPN